MMPKEELFFVFADDTGTMELANLLPSNEWEVTGTRMEMQQTDFQNSYQKLMFYITLKRKLSYYTFALIIPCILLSILTAGMFFIPPQSGEKIALGNIMYTH